MTTLTFKETHKRMGYRNVPHYLIRVPHPSSNDGWYTIGKIGPARGGRTHWQKDVPPGWCLSLNGDTDLSYDEMLQVTDFIEDELGGYASD